MNSRDSTNRPRSSVSSIALFGVLTGLGLGLKHNVLLLTAGRNSGRPRATPVNRLDIGAEVYLVAPRGTAGWVLNARAAGRVTLKRGRERRDYRVEELEDADKASILQTYLQRYTPTVQRYFPLKPDAGADEFRRHRSPTTGISPGRGALSRQSSDNNLSRQ